MRFCEAQKGLWAVVCNQFVLLPQPPKKMAPPESSIVVRYCPGQFAGGLLARGNISPGGRLGNEGEEGEGCWQAVSIATPKQSERPIGRAIFIG